MKNRNTFFTAVICPLTLPALTVVLFGMTVSGAYPQGQVSESTFGAKNCNYENAEASRATHSNIVNPVFPGNVAESQLPEGRELREQRTTLQSAMRKGNVSLTSLNEVRQVMSGGVPGLLLSPTSLPPVKIEDDDWFHEDHEEIDEVEADQLIDLLRNAFKKAHNKIGAFEPTSVRAWIKDALGNTQTIKGAKWMGSKTLSLLSFLFGGAKAIAKGKSILKYLGAEIRKKLKKMPKKKAKQFVKDKLNKMVKNGKLVVKRFKVKGPHTKGTIEVVYNKETGKYVVTGEYEGTGANGANVKEFDAEKLRRGRQGKKKKLYKGELTGDSE